MYPIKLGSFFFKIAGINLTEGDHQANSKRQNILKYVVMLTTLIYFCLDVYASIMKKPESNLQKSTYGYVMVITSWLAYVVMFTTMTLYCATASQIVCKLRRFYETYVRDSEIEDRIITIFELLAYTVFWVTKSVIDMVLSEELVQTIDLGKSTGATIIVLIVSQPFNLMGWAMFYNYILINLTELKSSKIVYQVIVQDDNPRSPEVIDAILPVLNIANRISLNIDGLTRNTHQRVRVVLNLHHDIQSVCLLKNRIYYSSVMLLMFARACNLPLMMAWLFRQSDLDTWRVFLLSITVLRTTFLLTYPILLRYWVKWRQYRLKIRITREIFATNDTRAMNLLCRYVSSAEDLYPDTPEMFLEFDSDLLCAVLDSSVLVATTLFTY